MEENVVLLIEDEKKLSDTVSEYLKLNGYRVLQALDGMRGLELFYDHMHEIDLVLLDIMMPGMQGDEVLRELRRASAVPIIMMTAKDAVESQIASFGLGADDYIVKPYVLSVVKAHIEAVLKRAGKFTESLEVGKLTLDVRNHRIYLDGAAVELTVKEYELLKYLIQNKNIVLKREMILNAVWGYEYEGDHRTVDTVVKQLRKKLGNYGGYIRSIYGAGYAFEVKEDAQA